MSTIDEIQAFVVPYTEPNDFDSTRWVCLVKVVDDNGTEGWGEATTLFRPASVATAALIAEWADMLVGVPTDPSRASQVLNEQAWWYGDAGIARFAQSGIDIALWDLTGKASSEPLSDALGAKATSIPFLISAHATDHSLERMASNLAEAVALHRASGIKVGFGKRGEAELGFDHDRDVNFVRYLRRELGDGPRIMVDIGAGIRWSLDEAIRRIQAFEEYNIAWTEEPLGPDHPDGYAKLAAAVNSLIAYGEREWSPRGYERITRTGTVDVVGIDPGRVGGITAFVESSRIIEKAGVQGNAHAFSGPIVYAASVALSLSSSAFRQIEITPRLNTLYSLVEYSEPVRSGAAQASTAPGLGIVVDEHRVRAAAVA